MAALSTISATGITATSATNQPVLHLEPKIETKHSSSHCSPKNLTGYCNCNKTCTKKHQNVATPLNTEAIQFTLLPATNNTYYETNHQLELL